MTSSSMSLAWASLAASSVFPNILIDHLGKGVQTRGTLELVSRLNTGIGSRERLVFPISAGLGCLVEAVDLGLQRSFR